MISRLFDPLAPSPYTEEELGNKKDDDLIHDKSNGRSLGRPTLRLRRKRLTLVMFAICIIWFLFTHRLVDIIGNGTFMTDDYLASYSLSSHMGGSVPSRAGFRGMGSVNVINQGDHDPTRGRRPPRESNSQDSKQYYYDGRTSFFALHHSLSAAGRLGGYNDRNKNVLFAAANLKSAAKLLGMACLMAKSEVNNVHFALVASRSEITKDQLLEANGISEKNCGAMLYFHDARPDYSAYSTEERAERSALAAMEIIRGIMHPQAVITDADEHEERFFIRSINTKLANDWRGVIPRIALPVNVEKTNSRPPDDLSWISRLDASSLGAWSRPAIEIMIRAPTRTSGNLIRLLKDLTDADYSGMTPPRLTIEMPSEADPMLEKVLRDFRWPPKSWASDFTLRRRIPIRTASSDEAAVRFMESFFPTHPDNSHVLILSPDVHLSPLYYQALMYYLLQLGYSYSPKSQLGLMGIALDLPTVTLNGTDPFTPPSIANIEANVLAAAKPAADRETRPPFVWQAPNTNAALYLGEPWIEMHSFISLRLAKLQSENKSLEEDLPTDVKKTGTQMPAWAEFALEFMRARGLGMFYPGGTAADEWFAVLREEHAGKPEEVPSHQKRSALSQSITINPAAFRTLLQRLPFHGSDPSLAVVPLLKWDGNILNIAQLTTETVLNAENFRKSTGGCANVVAPLGKKRLVRKGSAADLFCFGGDDEQWVSEKEGSVAVAKELAEDDQKWQKKVKDDERKDTWEKALRDLEDEKAWRTVTEEEEQAFLERKRTSLGMETPKEGRGNEI